MEQFSGWPVELYETTQDLLQDVLLLQALIYYTQLSKRPAMSQATVQQTFRRLSDYLEQHALDLYRLEQRQKPIS